MRQTDPVASPFVAALHEWMEVFIHRSMHDLIQYSKASGLSISQIRTLFQIQHQHASVSGIGGELGVTNAAVSQLLEPLVQDGLIARSEDPDDRRVKQILLTEKGKQTLEEIIRNRQYWLNHLVTLLTPEEQDQVIQSLHILIGKARQLEQIPSALFEEQP